MEDTAEDAPPNEAPNSLFEVSVNSGDDRSDDGGNGAVF